MADPSSSEMTGGCAFNGALDVRFEERVSNDHEPTIMATAWDWDPEREDAVHQPPRHQARHRDEDEDLGGRAEPLVVLAQAAGVAQPGEGALDDPTPRL